ncbi:MAG: MFS transporter [Chloroflexi bacterium]|nr:MFS transporter [Chloroflexota bacterium]
MEKSSFTIQDIIILLACVLIMGTTMGVVNVVLSIFYPIVAPDLEVSRASFALTGTITALSAMVAALFWGLFYSAKPLQKPMILSIIIFGLCFFGLQAARNLTYFYALAFLIGITYGGISIIPVSIIITRHFTTNTGFALSAALAGSGLGAMILNPIINTIINGAGWRVGYLLIAIVIFVITLPCAFLVTHLTKTEIQSNPKASPRSPKVERRASLKQAWLWAFLAAAFLSGLTGGGVLANLPTYMKDLNFSVSRISVVTSAYAASLVFGKILLGFFYDRLGAKKATLISGLLMTLSLGLMIFIDSTIMLILMLVFIGIGLSIGTVSITWLTNHFFGKEEYSKYYGTVQFANSLGIAVGVPVIAAGLENLENPTLLWIVITALSLVMVSLFVVSIRANQKMKASTINLDRVIRKTLPEEDETLIFLEESAQT